MSVFDTVENIVGKGENAGYQHFLLLPQCFQKSSFPDTTKGVIVGEWVKREKVRILPCNVLYQIITQYGSLSNIGRIEL